MRKWNLLFFFCLVVCALPSCAFDLDKMPEHLATGKVFLNQISLDKTDLVSDKVYGAFSEIKYLPSKQIATTSDKGAQYFASSGKLNFMISFKESAGDVDLVPSEKNKSGDLFKYLNRGSWGNGAKLFDENGKKLWSVDEKDGVNDATQCSLSGMRIGKYVVGYNGGSGISLLDKDGKEIWNQEDGNVWHVECFSPDQGTSAQIIHSNARGQITIRDADGNVVSRSSPPFYFSRFSLCRWPDSSGRERILACAQGSIWLLDESGRQIEKFDFPCDNALNSVKGVPVEFDSSKTNYLAVVVSWRQFNRSEFCLYDQKGQLVYDEVFEDNCNAVCSMEGSDSSSRTLLVGGNGVIYRYALTSTKSSDSSK